MAAAEVDRRFEKHRQSINAEPQALVREVSDEQVKAIQQACYVHLLEEDDELRLDGLDDATFEAWGDDVEWIKSEVQQRYARGTEWHPLEPDVEEVLSWSNVNIRLDPGSPDRKKIVRAIQAAHIQAAEAKLQRQKGEVIETPPSPDDIPRDETQGPLLSSVTDAWLTEKTRLDWRPKTANEHRVWSEHFRAICGDRPISTYTKNDARRFKEVLLKLPANWNKHEALRDLTIAAAADRAEELGMPAMSAKNADKVMGFVSSLWRWIEENYDEAPAQPFKGMKIGRKGQAREERDPFSTAELQAIFNAPLFTGCQSINAWKTPGPVVPRGTGRFWVPLIALFSGARSGEIIQLYISDVKSEDGITFFSLTPEGEDQHVKTPSARRRIPVHPKLWELGFAAFLAERRTSGEQRLFPDMPLGADGYYSSPFSKFFKRFLEAAGVKSPKNAFHSLRHSFEDACRNAGVTYEAMNTLQGHSDRGMSARYGKGLMLHKLNEEIQKVRYDSLDLSHCRIE